MEPTYKPEDHEERIYKYWESKGLFTAQIDKSKPPFCIILPPPNANADLHLGHAMYVYEDLMIRYRKMRGYETLWLPGADHAGFETQYVFEKQLQKEGKSRFDFDRETLYQMIWNFVMENKGKMVNQLKRLGFALDWTKEKFTLDPDIIAIVYETFEKLYDAGLVYREKRLVNYCVKDGTSFSDLEVVDNEVEAERGLYFVKYSLKDGGFIEVATTRPETLFGDTALMVNPKDKRYRHLIGKNAIVPIARREIPIIADSHVDIKFGTGAVKVTPAHDFDDFEIGKKHNLPMIQVINLSGKIQNTSTEYDGLGIIQARTKIEEDLKKQGILSVKKHKLVLKACYKCGKTLEPLPLEQWFIKIRPLADSAKKLVEKGKIKIHPTRFKKVLIQWLDNFHDWNISRQIVWGIRIPAYKCLSAKKWFVSTVAPTRCKICGKDDFVQDEDTFDTWFSSAQWPFAVLLTQNGNSKFQIQNSLFQCFYPTSVMETGYDILPWWVARMIMIGYFATGKVPFKNIFLHGMVRDKKGAKMSKSRGNVINPLEMVDKYGADAFRAALIFGVAEGNDISLSDEKVIGMRNFANKIWNIGRFILMNRLVQNSKVKTQNQSSKLKTLEKEFESIKKQYYKHMESYKFSKAFGLLYEFVWHRFADYYIEQLKESLQNGNIKDYEALKEVYLESLKMLHPFIPFVTEAVWQNFNRGSIYETNLST